MISLSKCRHILREAILGYKRLTKKLSPAQLQTAEHDIETLHEAIHAGDNARADATASELLTILKTDGKKTWVDHLKELVFAIIFAVCVAAVVRQTWFELYEIPTGSMRPTFKEHDRVLVVKNAFGINTPFRTSHLEFDPSLVKRGQTIVFSGDGLNMPDVDTTYFFLFPGKKRYVKRCLGKPGDRLYFYGGQMYGVDQAGNPLPELLSDPTFASIEHIPFLTFEGMTDVEHPNGSTVLSFEHFNDPIGRIIVSPIGALTTELKKNDSWQPGTDIGAFWGIKNYAMCRLLLPEDLPEEAKLNGYEQHSAPLYLELRHSPELPQKNMPASPHDRYILPSNLMTHFSWIPLDEAAMKQLKKALNTSRFIMRNGMALRYTHEVSSERSGIFLASDIPDGTYEFFDGVAYEINDLSYAKALPHEHPIYPHSKELLKKLFNSGIELSAITDPQPVSEELLTKKRSVKLFPARYAYFRDGDFYVIGKPLFEKNNPLLTQFEALEKKRHELIHDYPAFIDRGKPDSATIIADGLRVLEKQYVALGDNHAMSLDSRFFGFVPENNLQGSTRLIFWPVSDRMGRPPQPTSSFWRIQNAYVLVSVAIVTAISLWFFRRTSSFRRYEKLKAKRLGR